MDLFANTQQPILIKGDCLSACGFIAAGLAATGNLYLDETAAVAVHRVYDLHGRDDLQASLEAAQMLAEDGVPHRSYTRSFRRHRRGCPISPATYD